MCQTIFGEEDNDVGTGTPCGTWPVREGPRHWGQSSARVMVQISRAGSRKRRVQVMVRVSSAEGGDGKSRQWVAAWQTGGGREGIVTGWSEPPMVPVCGE